MLKVCPLKKNTRAFDSKMHKMRNLRTRQIILYWLFHALGAFVVSCSRRLYRTPNVESFGTGFVGKKKNCFCSAAGFLLLVRFYVDMLGPMFSAFGTAFIKRYPKMLVM